MNNFMVRANGTARVTITDPRVNPGTNSYSLFTGGGTALVIHAKADDMRTDPSGNSGDRIACGVISKLKRRERNLSSNVFYCFFARPDLWSVNPAYRHSTCTENPKLKKKRE